jgi:predicted cation transporter
MSPVGVVYRVLLLGHVLVAMGRRRAQLLASVLLRPVPVRCRIRAVVRMGLRRTALVSCVLSVISHLIPPAGGYLAGESSASSA